MESDYDICVIGGGINGVGIARDAAGRGLSVLLVEAQDLAQGTSSASTKLIHGGLRYLEQYEFKLVRESLKEREILFKAAPHIVRPQEFILPHTENLRPKWMIEAGLFLYDRLGGKQSLPRSSAVSLKDTLVGEPLLGEYSDGFRYADYWADDARLVVINAIDANARGAEILTRTACMAIERLHQTDCWYVHLKDLRGGDEFQISAKAIVNAAGPWVRGVLEASDLVDNNTPNVRLVKGSHIIVPRLYDGDHAYILQQPDRRVVFAIPYEQDYTVIGTTDEPFEGNAAKPVISDAEREYLCAAVNRFFKKQISPGDAPWTYSGVRALVDDGTESAQKVTRDYKLHLDTSRGAPILSVFGGKLTTYRHLSEEVVNKLAQNTCPWTANSILPGGDISGRRDSFINEKIRTYDFLDESVVTRYACSYGTRMDILLDGVASMRAMGRDFGGGLYEKEIFYLIHHEFAKSAEDILWRRSKLGLHLEKKTMLALEAAMPDYLKEAGRP
jgi:glycerol-3-phosphate dehydrogenase